MTDLIVADISEYQGTPSLAGQQAVIIRAHNGYRADKTFGTTRDAAHSAGCKVIGIYQYLLGGRDPAAQARLLLATVGGLAPGEFLICDLEESATVDGDEAPRYAAWRGVCAPVSPVTWLYTFLAFARAHNLQPDWLAAFQAAEPAGPHRLWQFTNAQPWPWGRSDASVFHGSVDQLAALVHPVPAPKPAPAPTPTPTPVPKGTTVYGPPLRLEPVASALSWPHGGVILLGVDGSVYSFGGSPFLGGANGQTYFAGRTAAHIDYRPTSVVRPEGYTIVDTAGERYDY